MADDHGYRPDERGELVDLLSRQFESLGDSAPADPRVAEQGSSLRFAFRWPLASWELLLFRSGQRERLRSFRCEFLDAIAPSLAEVVEGVTGREARLGTQALEFDAQDASLTFRLGASTGDGAEERRAVRNWSSQVRRAARRQRAEHRRRSEELERTARAVRDTRRRVRARGYRDRA